MGAIDGLYIHELIILILAGLLFITLLVIQIVFVIRKRQIKDLFIFFFLPFIMIGYLSFQKINYDKEVLSMEMYAMVLAMDPANSDYRKNLKIIIKKIERRPTNNYQVLTEFGKSQAILGDTVKAEKYVGKALSISPDFSEAKMLQKQYDTPQVQIEKLIAEIEKGPANTPKKTELEIRISRISNITESNTSFLITAARAHAILGDTSRAMTFVNKVLSNYDENSEAAELKKRFSAR